MNIIHFKFFDPLIDLLFPIHIFYDFNLSIKLIDCMKILLINIESESEAVLVNKLSKKINRKTSIGLRLNPDVFVTFYAPTYARSW